MPWVTKHSTETYAPPPPPREYTRAERRQNWWHYHWAWVALGAAGLVVLGAVLHDTVFRPRADIRIACVTRTALPDEVLAALETGLAPLAADVNGDGRVVVQAVPYVLDFGRNDAFSAEADMGARASLVADISAGNFYTLLLDDPAHLQQEFDLLAPLDGGGQTFAYRWQDCPVLAALDLGRYPAYTDDGTVFLDGAQAVQGLYAARRLPAAGETPPAEAAFWQALTAGAAPPA